MFENLRKFFDVVFYSGNLLLIFLIFLLLFESILSMILRRYYYMKRVVIVFIFVGLIGIVVIVVFLVLIIYYRIYKEYFSKDLIGINESKEYKSGIFLFFSILFSYKSMDLFLFISSFGLGVFNLLKMDVIREVGNLLSVVVKCKDFGFFELSRKDGEIFLVFVFLFINLSFLRG